MSAGTRAAVAEVAADGIPVVITSRVPGGRIAAPPLVEGTVVSHDLPAHKARVLLMLGLANGVDLDRLRRIFATY